MSYAFCQLVINLAFILASCVIHSLPLVGSNWCRWKLGTLDSWHWLVYMGRCKINLIVGHFGNKALLQLIEAEWRIYASLNWVIIGSDNGLSPVRRQAIIWTNVGILLIWPLGTNFNEMFIEIHTFSFKKIHLKMLSAKWPLFGLGLNELTHWPLGDFNLIFR